MNKKGVNHFSAAPDFSLLSTSRCKELSCGSGVGACGDVGDGGDIEYAVCGGRAVGGRGDVSVCMDIGGGIDVGGNNEFSEIDDGGALMLQRRCSGRDGGAAQMVAAAAKMVVAVAA